MPIEQESSTEKSEAAAALGKRLSGFETEEGRLRGLDFVPGPRDIGISTTPKAGTTWMQQICHQLRSTKSQMEFEEISEVVPWIELAHDLDQDLSAPQFGDEQNELRFFKTHAWADHCPKFAKTIVVMRDPHDVLLSFFKFFENWFFEPGEMSLDVFAKEFFLARDVPQSKMQNASYFVHLVSWFQRRNDDDVLIVFFEDMKQDLRREITRVANFLSTTDPRYKDPQRIHNAFVHSTYDFMKKHSYHFDEKLTKRKRNEACGLPKDAGLRDSKIRRGLSGVGADSLSPEIRSGIAEKWRAQVFPVTGCASYDELRRKFGAAVDT